MMNDFKKLGYPPEQARRMALAKGGLGSAERVIHDAGKGEALEKVPFAERKDARERQVRLPNGKYGFAKSASDAKDAENKIFALQRVRDLTARYRKIITEGSSASADDLAAKAALQQNLLVAIGQGEELGAMDKDSAAILEAMTDASMAFSSRGVARLNELDKTTGKDMSRVGQRLYKDHRATQAFETAQKSKADLTKTDGITPK